jgi:hypothetical protein
MTDVWLAELIGSPVGSFQGLLHTQQSWWEILFKNCPVSRGKGPFRLVRGGGGIKGTPAIGACRASVPASVKRVCQRNFQTEILLSSCGTSAGNPRFGNRRICRQTFHRKVAHTSSGLNRHQPE